MTIDTASIPTTAARERDEGALPRRRAIAALGAMMLTSLSLVSAEFLPGGIVTTLAADLGVTTGQAGQTVTITALVGFVVAPLVGVLTPGVDRRTLLVLLALAATVSNLVVAIAPSLWLLLLGRVLLGAALSGFWSMSLTVAARIGGRDRIARSMMFVGAGTTLATVLGVPLGVLATAAVGWRAVFVAASVLTVLTAVALALLLPRVPASTGVSLRSLASTLRRIGMRPGLAGHVLVVLGHMAVYAYASVAFARMPGADESSIATMLLAFGIAGFVGNFAIGAVADRILDPLRFVVPGLIAAAVLTLALWPDVAWLTWIAVAAWGFGFGGWLTVLNTWAARQVPDRLEESGGLVVAGFQLAITLGAGLGGLLVDTIGIEAELRIAGAVVVVGLVLFGTARRASTPTTRAPA